MKGCCSVDECGKHAGTKGWCVGHLRKWKLYGSPMGKKLECVRCGVDFYATKTGIQRYCSKECRAEKTASTVCIHGQCGRRSHGSTYCPMHQKRLQAWGSLDKRPPSQCGHCGEMFVRVKKYENYCGSDCRQHARDEYNVKYFSDPKVKAERAQYNRRRAQHNKKVSAEWYAANRNRFKDFNWNNRKRADVFLDLSASDLEARMSMWGFRCWMCDGPFEAIDHVKPVSKGGPHMLSNLRPICRSCNGRKHSDWPLSQVWARLNADTLFGVSEVSA